MPSSRVFLAVSLLVLFVAFSFNAYACLVPIFATADGSMAKGCPSSDQPAPKLFCDTFKTLGVSSPDKADLKDHGKLALDVSSEGLLPQVLSPAHELTSGAPPLSAAPASGHISVLRL
jgi:hypothetical protein